MKAAVYIFVLILAHIYQVNQVFGQDAEAFFVKATREFNNGNSNKAIILYEELLDKGYNNAAIYNNLGVAYFNKNIVGLSILNFERGLLYNPSNEQLSENLTLIRKKLAIAHNLNSPYGIEASVTNITHKFSADQFAVICIILLSLGTILYIMSLIDRKLFYRHIGIAFILLALLTHIGAYLKVYHQTQSKKSVVLISTVIRVAPSVLAKEKHQLYEGLTVEVKDSFEGWSKVRITDDKVGWIPDSTMAFIVQQ